jgi:hypothetical protein
MPQKPRRILPTLLMAAAMVAPAFAQPKPAERLAFEVTSVKPNKSEDRRNMRTQFVVRDTRQPTCPCSCWWLLRIICPFNPFASPACRNGPGGSGSTLTPEQPMTVFRPTSRPTSAKTGRACYSIRFWPIASSSRFIARRRKCRFTLCASAGTDPGCQGRDRVKELRRKPDRR